MMTVIPPKFPPHGYQTLRDAFEQFGRERIPGWTGEEVETNIRRLAEYPNDLQPQDQPALARWVAALESFMQELEARRLVIVTLTADGRLHEVPTDHWRTSDAAVHLADSLIEPDFPRYVPFPVASDPMATTGVPKAKRKRGVSALATWGDYQQRFNEKCDKEGYPDDLNVDGWQRLADVRRWLEALTRRDGKTNREGKQFDRGDTVIKDHARRFMDEYPGAKGH